jgi:hypothetical protein
MSKHDCPHGLDLRKHPRCYLCQPLQYWEGGTGIVIKPSLPITSGIATQPWCSICHGYHRSGPCLTTYS